MTKPGPIRNSVSIQTELKRRGRNRRQSVKELAPLHPRRNDLCPKLQLVERAPADLAVPARNVRKIDPAHVREVANAIAALGFCDPPLIDENNEVLDGVVRVEAAKQLGLASITCVRGDHLTASEKRLARLALNRTSEKGEWDFGTLKLEFEELILAEVPVEISGFSLPEIDQLRLNDEVDPCDPGPLSPEGQSTAVSRLGDLFALGQHTLTCGDATDAGVLARLMGEAEARFVFTDQPYNVKIRGHVTSGAHREFAMASGEMSDEEFRRFNELWITVSMRHLCAGGILGTFIDWRGYPSVHAAATKFGLEALNLAVWSKTNAGMGSLYRNQHELLPLYKKGDAPHVNNVALGKHGRWRSNVWTYAGASSFGSDARRGLQEHPTVKPVAMLEDALLDLTNRGDLVLDPFLGSGSTLIAAEKTGRVCRGVELDPLYVDVILRRYERMTGRQGILNQTGESFAALAERRRQEQDQIASDSISDKLAQASE